MSKKKSTIVTSRLDQIDANTYPQYYLSNISSFEIVKYETIASSEQKCKYNPYIEPSFQLSCKEKATSSKTLMAFIFIQINLEPYMLNYSFLLPDMKISRNFG